MSRRLLITGLLTLLVSTQAHAEPSKGSNVNVLQGKVAAAALIGAGNVFADKFGVDVKAGERWFPVADRAVFSAHQKFHVNIETTASDRSTSSVLHMSKRRQRGESRNKDDYLSKTSKIDFDPVTGVGWLKSRYATSFDLNPKIEGGSLVRKANGLRQVFHIKADRDGYRAQLTSETKVVHKPTRGLVASLAAHASLLSLPSELRSAIVSGKAIRLFKTTTRDCFQPQKGLAARLPSRVSRSVSFQGQAGNGRTHGLSARQVATIRAGVRK